MSGLNRREFVARTGRLALAPRPAQVFSPRPGRAKSRFGQRKGHRGDRGPARPRFRAVARFRRPARLAVAYLADVDTTIFDPDSAGGIRGELSRRLPRYAAGRDHQGPGQGAEASAGFPPRAGRQVGRRGGDRHARSLALAGHDLGLPGRQGRVRRKAAKPDPWEGRKAVEAARKYQRIVQMGTQSRTAPYYLAAKKYLTSGKLGKIHLCRVFNMKEQRNFPLAPDSDPPEGFDWDMWNGPAPEHPLQRDVPAPVASSVALFGRRHHQRRHAPDGSRPLAVRRGVSQVGLLAPEVASTARGRPKRPTRRSPPSNSTTW